MLCFDLKAFADHKQKYKRGWGGVGGFGGGIPPVGRR